MPLDDLPIDADLVIPARELSFSAVRSSGPGGQNVNKVASKVILRFDVQHSQALTAETKARLLALAGHQRTDAGEVLISAAETRDQSRNLQVALDKLRALILRARVRPKKRRATKPTRGSTERRLKAKAINKAHKQARRSRGDD